MGIPLLIIILVLGVLANSRIVVLASSILLLFKALQIDVFFRFFSDRGIEIGLVFLLLAVLSSLLVSPLGWEELKLTFASREGIVAVLAGLTATRFNKLGLNLLHNTPQIIIGIVAGSLLGIVFLQGIPVGPMMAAGLTALMLKAVELLG
ncbi:MAG: DUF441 domain-containing protein [Halanaerobiaceae bacterium]